MPGLLGRQGPIQQHQQIPITAKSAVAFDHCAFVFTALILHFYALLLTILVESIYNSTVNDEKLRKFEKRGNIEF